MNGPRQQFLAGPALPGDEDGDVAGGVQFGLLQHLQQRRAAGDDLFKCVRVGENGGTAAALELQDIHQPLALERALDREDQVVLGDGFDEVVVSALSQALQGGAGVVHGRDHDALGRGALALDQLQEALAVHLGHAQVDQSDVDGRLRFEAVRRRARVVQHVHGGEPGCGQSTVHQLEVIAVVVDDQDRGSHNPPSRARLSECGFRISRRCSEKAQLPKRATGSTGPIRAAASTGWAIMAHCRMEYKRPQRRLKAGPRNL